MRDRFNSGLRYLQFALRGVQFCCAIIVLAIYSYFLAALGKSSLSTPTYVRAVEGISGVAALYVVCVCVLLRFVVGVTLTSFLTIFFDFAFLCSFIYVAQANRGGAGSCEGTVDTPFGTGDANSSPKNTQGLPKLRQACQLLTACMAVSIIVIFFFIFSILVEVQLGRMRHREKRFGPGGLPPSKVEGGISNYSPMKWFHMHKGDDDLASNGSIAPQNDHLMSGAQMSGAQMSGAQMSGAQIGTVTEFGDDRLPTPQERLTPPPQGLDQSQSHIPLMGPSQMSLPLQSQPGPYDSEYQSRPPPVPLVHANTVSDLSYPNPPMARVDTWRGQQPQSFGPPMRAATFGPRPLQRAGTMPLGFQREDSIPLHAQAPGPRPLQRMDSLPRLGPHRADSFGRPLQRTATDNISYIQSQRPHPYQQPGLQRTGSFPYSLQGDHIANGSVTPPRYATPPPLPQGVAGQAPYPDTRFLRPDLHPQQQQGELPYPDDHPERLMFPGDRLQPGQGSGSVYPNYQYDESIYNRSR